MDRAWLESLLAVAKHGSFTRAAQELRLTQPGVSRQVQKLERELGTALIERGGAAVRLTPAGERVRAYAEQTLTSYRQLLSELHEQPPALAGELRIAASTTPGEFLVPRLVAGFTARYPGVRPRVFIADSAIVIDELREQSWDVGFVGARLARTGLRYRAVAEDEVVLAVPAGHRFAARGEVALDELADQPFVEREDGSGTALSVHRILARHGLALPPHRTVMVLSTTQAIVSAVANGYGIGWVSSLALEQRGTVRVALVRLAGVRLGRVLELVYDRRRPLPPVAAAFIDWVARERATGEPVV